MSDQNDTPRERPTVALAVEKIEGLRDLMRAEFGTVGKEFGAMQRQLDAVAGLPVEVAKLSERIKKLEDDATYRGGPLITMCIAATAVLVSLAGYFIN